MIIRDHTTGRNYQLSPGSTLQVERGNPFFNDYGEQSLPLDLPDTPLNRQLTGQPGELANASRPDTDRLVVIEDGAYHVRAHRQVLSARRGGSISTSYLLEQSNLYAKIGGLQLTDVFASAQFLYVRTADGTSTATMTLDQRMAFLDGLKNHQDPHYDIFPVAMTMVDAAEHSFGYRLLNAYGRVWKNPDKNEYEFWPDPASEGSQYASDLQWLNGPVTIAIHGGTKDRRSIQFANDTTLNLQRGYYMSPFIRAIYVLECVISYLGYTLDYPGRNGVGTPDPVMTRMVFVNNTIDACVNGTSEIAPADQESIVSGILNSDLVPDCSCSDLLDMFRYKFNQEFIVNDVTGVVTMQPFGTMLNAAPVDLTPYLVGRPLIEYPESYRRTVLSPAAAQSGDTAPELTSLLDKYPAAVWDPVRGGWIVSGHRGYSPVTEFVIDGNTGYSIDDHQSNLTSDEHKSPDTVPSFVALIDSGAIHAGTERLSWTFPYIGDERALHSQLSGIAADDSPAVTERPKLDMMLLLPYTGQSYPRGTLTDYDYYTYYSTGGQAVSSAGIGGSLCYHGVDGLFERYWRMRDNLTRNALCKVRASLLLPSTLKMSLSPLSRILLHGSSMFVDTLAIVLGTEEAIESTLLSATPQAGAGGQLSQAPTPDTTAITGRTGYHWQLRHKYYLVTEDEYSSMIDFPSADYLYNPSAVFPKERAAAGNEGNICSHQLQYDKMEVGGIRPFFYDLDEFWWRHPTDNWQKYDILEDSDTIGKATGLSFQGSVMINDGYYELGPEQTNYFDVVSELVCVRDPDAP